MYKIEDCPKKIQNHFFLQARDIGASRKLVGKVGMITIYASKTPQCWSLKSKEEYEAALKKATEFLEKEAKCYGANLQIETYSLSINLPADFERFRGFEYIKKEFKVNSMEEMQCSFEKHYNVDEAPVIIVFDEVGRSSAAMQHSPSMQKNELSSIFRGSKGFSYTTIAHEILHQFGASDFYFPKRLEKYAKKYFVNSVMGIGSPEIVDDLSAYLVGWKDEFSENAYKFLSKTVWYTERVYRKELDKQWK